MRGDTLLDKGVQTEIEISESDEHHIIVIKTIYGADGKVMVKSTTNKNLYSDLDEFIRSWYSFWDAHDEGILL
jgi:hypothetical protein